ncbi:cytochrome d ubiquinol oxidase subunit II [Luteipulveratus sp. YIM 133132]|uniref:Cytochrome d ubiquinol oxidase subunit II n=1 Tax=Luteipulveratus flavus TaxID=3031728 RepID=A0ABT6C5U3_9MICO|nr:MULTISPECIES: cytochrome d ubiquinol oxidase subunit II [unclassified Luteipulveratus]MDE9366730.1 cytochrome d ubiquinol oxidase subunit II [Luteipulveratus sp. YIM 133132]MDF8264218.1 cytochrome d ubiquinol oxidase subunit II [Luteipulveratus sp. YIM 133296]
MELTTVWFVLIAVLWTGYFCLEGFDFGVGMLFPVLGRSEERRRVLLNTIGPVWDGNEVWLLTAGGATFAAFPHWYATLFSGFYLPLLLILLALIVRALGFEYRHKRNDDQWRRRWDAAIVVGSAVPAFLWGVAFTNIVRGVPIDADKEFTGSLLTLLNPIALLGGLATLTVFLLHGLLFVALKTDGEIRSDARALATRVGWVAAGLGVALLVILGSDRGGAASLTTSVLAAGALLAALASNARGREGWAFTGTFIGIALVVASLFLMLFPDVMPSSTNAAWSLTVDNAASSAKTLGIMTWVGVLFLPIVLLYQGFTYWTFRKRISTHHIPPATDERDWAPSGAGLR